MLKQRCQYYKDDQGCSSPLVLVTTEGNGMNSMRKAVLCQTKGLLVLGGTVKIKQ